MLTLPKDAVSGQKLRLIFVTNDSFDNDEIGAILSKFEGRFKEFATRETHDLIFKDGSFSFSIR